MAPSGQKSSARLLPLFLLTGLLLFNSRAAAFQAVGTPSQPVISGISPGVTFVNAGAILLDVRGSNFTATSSIRINGASRRTTFVSSSELTTTLLDADTAAARSLAISVFTPNAAAGVSSNSASMEVVSRTASSDRFPFVVPSLGGLSLQSSGAGTTASVGYARMQPDGAQTTPAGFVIFGYRQNGVLVSEASVPASTALTSARVYVENAGGLRTGIAIANPGASPAVVSFSLVDSNGREISRGSTTIPAGNQIAKFLNEAPFNAPASIQGAISLSASAPIGIVALRALVNELGDFLMTTLPVADLSMPASSEPSIVPHFADGGGWSTHFLLVNPTDQALAGTLQFMPQAGVSAGSQPVRVTVGGQPGNSFAYSIAPKTSVRLSTAGAGSAINAGWARVTPSGTSRTPSVLGVFSFRNGAVTTTEAGVAGIRASSSFRVYAESSEDRGGSRDIETGMAIANPGTQAETLNLELLSMSGAPTGLRGTATAPAQGQIALFVNQIAGLASRQAVQGILRVSGSSSTSAIAVVGLRGRYNERGDFLITTTPPIDESGTPSTSELLLPHIVDGGGYNSQFVILSDAGGTSGNGLVQLWSQAGRPLLVRGDAPPAEPVPPCPTTSSYTDSIGDIFQAPAAAPVDSRNNVILPGASSFTGQENLPADSFNSGPNDVVRHNINGNRGAVAQLYPNYSPSSPNLYAYLNNPENPCGPPSIGGETPDEPADTNLSDVPNEDTLNSLATTLVDNSRILEGESPNLPPITTTPGIPAGPCDPVAEWNGKRCDLPAGAFQGRDIIFVNGLMPDALRDVALGQRLPTWPNQPSGFLSPGGYWWSKALEAWERHYSRFFEQTGRKNRYLIIRYSTAQRLSVGRHAMLTQIDMAMKTGLNVVNPDPNDPRGTSGFCYAKCVIVTHSTGALLTDLTLATAADESLASTLGAVSYIPDFIQLHVALGGAISGSTWARAALIASNGLDPAGTTAYCHMMNLVLDLPLSTSCSPTGVFNSSILVDLEPIMAQSLWGPVIGAAPPGKRPIPTITITGAHHDSYLIAKRWIVLGQDDGVVNMDSGCGKNVPHHEWPSGFVPRHPILNTSSSVSPLVYDKGIDTLDSIDAASRATRYFREQTYEHLLSPYAFFPARVGAACTPYLSGWGMVEPLDSIVADPPAASPLNYYPNHYPLIQSGEKHSSLKGGDQAKYEDTLATSGRGVDIMNRPGGLGLVDRAIENILQEEVRGEEISFWLPINISVSTGSCPAQPPVAPNKWCKRIGAFRVLYNKKWYAWWVWKRTYHRLYDWRQTPAAEYMYRYVLPNP